MHMCVYHQVLVDETFIFHAACAAKYSCSPPVRWWLLDFMSAVLLLLLLLLLPRQTSTASSWSQWSPLDPNSKLRIRVRRLAQSSPKDIPKIYQMECQKICQIHMPERMSEDLPNRMSEYMSDRMFSWGSLEECIFSKERVRQCNTPRRESR